jgi:hypothetical protein
MNHPPGLWTDGSVNNNNISSTLMQALGRDPYFASLMADAGYFTGPMSYDQFGGLFGDTSGTQGLTLNEIEGAFGSYVRDNPGLFGSPNMEGLTRQVRSLGDQIEGGKITDDVENLIVEWMLKEGESSGLTDSEFRKSLGDWWSGKGGPEEGLGAGLTAGQLEEWWTKEGGPGEGLGAGLTSEQLENWWTGPDGPKEGLGAKLTPEELSTWWGGADKEGLGGDGLTSEELTGWWGGADKKGLGGITPEELNTWWTSPSSGTRGGITPTQLDEWWTKAKAGLGGDTIVQGGLSPTQLTGGLDKWWEGISDDLNFSDPSLLGGPPYGGGGLTSDQITAAMNNWWGDTGMASQMENLAGQFEGLQGQATGIEGLLAELGTLGATGGGWRQGLTDQMRNLSSLIAEMSMGGGFSETGPYQDLVERVGGLGTQFSEFGDQFDQFNIGLDSLEGLIAEYGMGGGPSSGADKIVSPEPGLGYDDGMFGEDYDLFGDRLTGIEDILAKWDPILTDWDPTVGPQDFDFTFNFDPTTLAGDPPNQPGMGMTDQEFWDFMETNLEPWIQRMNEETPWGVKDYDTGSGYAGGDPEDLLSDPETVQMEDSPEILLPEIYDYTDTMREPLIGRTLDRLNAANPFDARRDAYLSGAFSPIDQYYDEAIEGATHRLGVLDKLGTPGGKAEISELYRDRASQKGTIGSAWELAAAQGHEGIYRNRLQDLSSVLDKEWDRTQQEMGLHTALQTNAVNDYYRNIDQYRAGYNQPQEAQDRGLSMVINALGGAGQPDMQAAGASFGAAEKSSRDRVDAWDSYMNDLWDDVFSSDQEGN